MLNYIVNIKIFSRLEASVLTGGQRQAISLGRPLHLSGPHRFYGWKNRYQYIQSLIAWVVRMDTMSRKFHHDDYVAVHEHPVWKDRSDFIIRVFLEEKEGHNDWEQLWAKNLGQNRFMICCIPFFVYNLSLGDEVIVDNDYNVSEVVHHSGNTTFRVWFGNSRIENIGREIYSGLENMEAILEWSSENLLAVSIDNQLKTKLVSDYLMQHQEKNGIMYEAGNL